MSQHHPKMKIFHPTFLEYVLLYCKKKKKKEVHRVILSDKNLSSAF